jgi:hypothetical protein
MRLAGLLTLAGLVCLVAAGFLVGTAVGFAVAGFGLLWLARLTS